jgi:hypothetical protein
LAARFLPRNRLHFAGIEFFDAASDFAAPFLFRSGVHRLIKTFEERTGERRAGFGRESQGFPEKFGTSRVIALFFASN